MIDKDIKFDFNDILIKPATMTEINSRYKDIILPEILPLFTAPMDTVVNLDNAKIFQNNKINVVLPRTVTLEEYEDYVFHNMLYKLYTDVTISMNNNMFISLGFEDIENLLKTKFKNILKDSKILIDVANGGMSRIVGYCKEIKSLRPDIIIMVGNIANPDTYTYYAQNDCVNFIRCGIGSGSGCLTSENTSIGFSMASLIHETYLKQQEFIENNEIDKQFENSLLHTKPVKLIPAIVADGGFKNYSDLIKALGLGAQYIMIGSIFNKALESAGDNYLYNIKINKNVANYLYDKGFPIKKHFRGMSTKEAQKAMGKTNLKTSEGVTRYRKVEYHLNGWVENFEHYLRSAMSYTNCRTLEDFIGKVDFIRITENSFNRFNK